MSNLDKFKEGFFAVIASKNCESNANVIEKVVMPMLAPALDSDNDLVYLINRILDIFANPSDYDVRKECSYAVNSFLIDYHKAQNTFSGEEGVCSSAGE